MGFDISIIISNWPIFASGLGNTVLFSAASILGGLCLGVVVALGRISGRVLLRTPAAVFIEVIRDTPFLVQVYIVYYVLPSLGISMAVTTAGILSLSLFAGAYFAESIRGAISSVPRGQMDAARATGMSYLLAMRRIVFPQMMGYLVPSLTNNMIGVVKESSVLSIITLPEVTMATQIVLGQTFAAVEAYTVAAVLYWLLTTVLAIGMGYLERRTPTYRSRQYMPAVAPPEARLKPDW